MYIVYNSKLIKEVESGGTLVNLVLLEIGADSIDDFPAPDAEEGQLICFGSIGYEINTGKFYVLNSEGTWKDSSGSAAANEGDGKSATLSSPLLNKGDKIEIEQPEEKELEILDTDEKGDESLDTEEKEAKIFDAEKEGAEIDDEPVRNTESQ